MSLYVGLMSGTSMDGIDAALVDIRDCELSTIASLSVSYPNSLQKKLFAAIAPDAKFSLHDYATLDVEVGQAFASACNELLDDAGRRASDVVAIGSHGQTLQHSPRTSPAYTIQIGDGATIAAQTKIDVVNNFRNIDVATGGQGAPLVPAFHEWMFRDDTLERVVLNIGGIANVTLLPKDSRKALVGFDTGPGNCLMDAWIMQCRGKPYDDAGQWAASGHCSETLLEALRRDEYFSASIPKSTGREQFNVVWVR
ncbi:MAG: anhydro-N-acetylmuramic acid kinase, partial [Gammaproteobacteria bacterium]